MIDLRKSANGTINWDTVDSETMKAARHEFQQWNQSEAAPAYQRLIEVEVKIAKLEKQGEVVAVLDGTRNRQSLPKAAVRFESLRYLQDMPSRPPKAKRKAAGSTVTAEEYNALLDDVTKLYDVLGSIGVIISRNTR